MPPLLVLRRGQRHSGLRRAAPSQASAVNTVLTLAATVGNTSRIAELRSDQIRREEVVRRARSRRSLALAWLLHQHPSVVPIPGSRTPAQIDENLAASRLRLDADLLARDEHNGFACNEWRILGGRGNAVLEGVDVVLRNPRTCVGNRAGGRGHSAQGGETGVLLGLTLS